ncbi:MAG: substrate-binding domain-containing protein [Bacillota bacterium]
MKKALLLLVLSTIMFSGCFLWDARGRAQPEELVLATTTSTVDTGLLDFLLPEFEKEYNAKVRVVAVGTGQAIQLGRSGDADVILVHSREAEERFVNEGYGVKRYDVMYNDFVLLGPSFDPAGVSGAKTIVDALGRIASRAGTAQGVVFASRGDDSGTHRKEMFLWDKAGVGAPRGEWYSSLGQGMGDTLIMADEMRAYVLSDRGTYLSMKDKLKNLSIVFEGDEDLFNPYGIIAVNPEKHPNVNFRLAQELIAFFTSIHVQQMINTFGVDRYGQPLFFPNSEQWWLEHGGE